MKILIASHSHPKLSKGGAEISAYQLFDELRKKTGFESSFLGCDNRQTLSKVGATITQPFSEREFVYAAGAFDWFKFANVDANFPRAFRALLKRLRPQIAHFHHYIGFGVEAFLHVREVLPECKIVLTLHEYLAICHHYGQMITSPERHLCHEAAPTACTGCFAAIAASDFFLRKLYIQRFFDVVDHFIAPSRFLADRYIDWGIPAASVTVVENVVRPARVARAAAREKDSDLLQVGFFGQISHLKGIDVLLDAADILQSRGVSNIIIEINGDYRGQPQEFQRAFLERLAQAGSNVKFNGPYSDARIDSLMQAVSVVAMPSIWWENSPVVIQEALRNRRPVICSDIGGMAEKVRDGVDGFHFPMGNPVALASLLHRLAKKSTLLAKVRSTMASPAAATDILMRHTALYQSLVA